ncbi:aldose 1-epimerase [Nocardia sp. CDC159]|uniref:Aldose 1-epimerase n=1 Tax=Nocardia pulmonis TaxID=2951408 RepID=A0A9X2E6K8_9NOCA|nr:MULTISPECIES: aldose 1-epimerase [Nocardia]MCM6775184.1 aldose 1-epimerase [Nocardia pulmonis]MCM6789654.1 aldose 1-epimerase [Nocardia sp. CDC159]
MGVEELRLSAGAAELTVNAATGRIANFRIGAAEILRTGPRFGSFPMAPWCGRMREGRLVWNGRSHQLPRNAEPHAIHGTVRDHPWEVVGHSGTELVLTQQLAEPWPFPGRVTQTFTLAADSATFGMTVEATAEPFPAQVGWHPWFQRRLRPDGKPVEFAFTPAWQEERGADYLPDGNRIAPLPGPWDDCFGMPDGVAVTLTWPDAIELAITSPLRWVVVYDQPAETVCVEPQSGPPNGLNTRPRAVGPDAPLVAEMRWQWRVLD